MRVITASLRTTTKSILVYEDTLSFNPSYLVPVPLTLITTGRNYFFPITSSLIRSMLGPRS